MWVGEPIVWILVNMTSDHWLIVFAFVLYIYLIDQIHRRRYPE